MKRDDEDALEEPRQYASSPCYLHELDPLYRGGAGANTTPGDEDATNLKNPADWTSTKSWRQRERRRLLASREKLTDVERGRAAESIITMLRKEFDFDGTDLGFYWPLPGEIDLRPFVSDLWANNTKAALPVIVKKNRPLEFWEWNPQMELETSGIWGIPTPHARKLLRPKILLVPLLGFDRERHRLGHGGGYYDRTLAALTPRPLLIGIGYDLGCLDTIHPQGHDVPMDVVVTECGIF